ncbi:MAG: sulfite exporter TauE/SafE family protein [Flavobacteriales bacterium]|nr:sulfite exporter TauE/SafE family protein [Flavobacteriales bacterium]
MFTGVDNLWLFYSVLPIVAFLYAAVGHGGASGYLALMVLFNFSPEYMKPTALLLNLFVAGIAFIHYFKEGHFSWRLFLAFAIGSIPLAFFGGTFDIEASLYKKILGVLLIIAIARMLMQNSEDFQTKQLKWWQGVLIGACIGFFSGLIGIGGGIILTPVILLFHWGNMKEAAAVSALFIWVNSGAGILGLLTNGVTLEKETFMCVGIAVIGGFFGSYYGSKKMKNKTLSYLLMFVLILASAKLFFT